MALLAPLRGFVEGAGKRAALPVSSTGTVECLCGCPLLYGAPQVFCLPRLPVTVGPVQRGLHPPLGIGPRKLFGPPFAYRLL